MAGGSERLDVTDLDEEDLKVLSEVSRKGYYHGRPKNEAESQPKPLKIAEGAVSAEPERRQRRADFDDYQKKWDKLDRELSGDEDTDTTAATSSRTRIAPPSAPAVDEGVVEQLVAMGFSAEDSRAAAAASQNRVDAAVELLFAKQQAPQAPKKAAAPDEGKVAQLVEMGIAARLARQALAKTGNDLEAAVDMALGGMEDESALALRKAEAEAAELEKEAAGLAAGCSVKSLRGPAESVTQLSCRLDAVDVEGDDALREQRRALLNRCGELEARIAELREAAASEPPAAGGEQQPGAEKGEKLGEAGQLRMRGNEAFKQGDFAGAAKHYEGALELDGEDVAILSNLAAAELKLGRFEDAADHAAAANLLAGGFSGKALFREGQALEALGRLSEAAEAFGKACQVEPNDKLLAQRLAECRRRLQEEGFK